MDVMHLSTIVEGTYNFYGTKVDIDSHDILCYKVVVHVFQISKEEKTMITFTIELFGGRFTQKDEFLVFLIFLVFDPMIYGIPMLDKNLTNMVAVY